MKMLAVDLDLAAVDVFQRHQDAQDRRLARTGRVNQRQLLARHDLHRLAVQHLEGASKLFEMASTLGADADK